MQINRLDHLVLTVADVEETTRFYHQVLGMEAVTFQGGRTALRFGTSKINLHQVGREPKAARPTAGSADVCLVVDDPIESMMTELADAGVVIEEGPVERTGATGVILSCYLRDPDGNLIELSNYVD